MSKDELIAKLIAALREAQTACGSAMWVANNEHNYRKAGETAHGFILAMGKDARRGYGAVTNALCYAEESMPSDNISAAERDVLAERQKQRAKWGDEHDDRHTEAELTLVAGNILREKIDRWGLYVKNYADRRQQLVIAAALTIAEIERLDRLA